MSGPRKGVKKTVLSVREKKFAQNVVAGMSDRQAALEAGYTESMAGNTNQKIWSKPEVQAYFRGLMQRAAPPERIIRKISEHIEGKSVTTRIRKRTVPSSDPKRKGEEVEETVIEKTETIDANVSLRACEMAIEIGEYVPAKEPGAQVEFELTLEQALIQAGETWEPPTWAKPLPGAEL